MLVITSTGQLIAALVMIAAMFQVVFILATPTEIPSSGESPDISFNRLLMMLHVAVAVIAATVYIILGATTL